MSDMVSAEEAQAMLQDMADGRGADDIAARARAFYRLGDTVIALHAERDDALRRLDLATETACASDRSLYAIRNALDGTAVPPPGDSLARQVYEVAQREADFAADLRAARAVIDGRATPPSLTEIAAHEAAGGRWLITLPSHSIVAPLVFVLDRGVIDVQAYRGDARVTRWWKLDAAGRLRAEPSSESGAP